MRKTSVLGPAIAIALAVEAGSWLGLWILRAQPGLFPPGRARSMAELGAYLETRDPVLGWPSRRGSSTRDSTGSRIVPAFPDPGHECASAYGGSFVYGSDVDHAATWVNQLSRTLGCRVANFGVDGYGTDQALLRFRMHPADSAPVSMLGIISHHMLRNTTQNAYFLWGGSYVTTLKPRFVLDEDDHLTLVALPDLDSARLELALQNPGAVFAFDELLPGTARGPVIREFPFTLSAIRWTVRGIAQRLETLPWRDVIDPASPSDGYDLTVRIVRAFVDECADRLKTCFAVVFPEAEVLEYLEVQGTSVMQAFQRDLETRGILVLDLVHGISARLGDRSYCDILVGKHCTGHYNAAGNKLVADLIYEFLQAHDTLRTALRPAREGENGRSEPPPR